NVSVGGLTPTYVHAEPWDAQSAQVWCDDPAPQFVALAVHVQAVLEEQLRARPAVDAQHRRGDIDEVDIAHSRRLGPHQHVRTLLCWQLVDAGKAGLDRQP